MLSVVRKNLLNRENYTPYCGDLCGPMPRTFFNKEQFECPACGWTSGFEAKFIATYKKRWGME